MRAASEGKRSKDFVFMPQSLALSGLGTKKVKFSGSTLIFSYTKYQFMHLRQRNNGTASHTSSRIHDNA